MLIGAHVSTAGGFDKAIDRATELGAEVMQCFCSSPQGWAFKPLQLEQETIFIEKAQSSGIGPIFLHGIYLVNMGTSNDEHLRKGIQSLTNYMDVASAIGGVGVIFHPGSHKGLGYEMIFGQVVKSIAEVLSNSPEDTFLIIENSAGMGNHIGSKFEEIGRIIRDLEDDRIKVCLDTQHCFAAGYDLFTPEGLDRSMAEFDREIGISKLIAVHANDSKTSFASGVDRHENIGHGYIGEEGFLTIMSHQAFKDIPFILEVPGFENKGPDKENVDILRRLRERVIPLI